MINSPADISSEHKRNGRDILLFAENRSKTTDLGAKSSSDVLGSI